MAIPYPNVSLPHETIQYVAGVTNNWWSYIVLIAIMVATYVTLGKIAPNKAFGGSMFLTSIVTILFWYLQIITIGVLIIAICLLLISIVWLKSTDKKY